MPTIGISYYPKDELFYSGRNQTALLLAELFSVHLEYKVTFVDIKNSEKVWWDDYPQPSYLQTVPSQQASTFDYFMDIDGLIHPESRAKLSARCIVFLRTFVQFSELDNSSYYETPFIPRYFEQLYQVWCWDVLNPQETLDSIQTLFSCPLRTVPFIWSPTVTNHFMKPISRPDDSITDWRVHVAEKNTNNTSSSVLPLVAIRELARKKILSATYYVHNMEHIQENRFLKENVLHNIESSTLPIEFTTKQHYYDWNQPNDILFSHSRFVPLRTSLLQALWLGIPVIHNSPILKELHPALASTYYAGNEIGSICQVFMNFACNYTELYQYLPHIRHVIMHTWGITSRLEEWKAVHRSLESDLSVVSSLVSSVVSSLVPSLVPSPPKEGYLIAFSDMWPGFNYDQNFIMDSLRHHSSKNMKGVRYGNHASIPDIVICGPYSTEWKDIPSSVPKVYFSAENWVIPNDPNIRLYITSSTAEDDTHIRVPVWMTFIDWFSGSKELPTNVEDNPIRLPVHFALHPHPVPFESRPDFCGFVVSNPMCSFRNDTFHAIHQYKHVDSGGTYCNNTGGALELTYPGGGCGDISKHHFFTKHRFTISFENSQAPGYITEKVLHAKMAGCVPLYWGDIDTDKDFVPGSVVNLSSLSNPAQVVSILKKIEENVALCAKIASTPLLDRERHQKAEQCIARMATRILALLDPSDKKERVVLDKIDKVYVINLDTRPDRWQKLIKSEPYLENIVERIPAVNGKTLTMNPFIYNLFERNEFKWKKSVIGCNLSHMMAWSKVLTGEGKYVLILEDDVRFEKDWVTRWVHYAAHIPEDADLLYLGGVLPPNKPALPQLLEQVNAYWSKIKPNTFFSPVPLPIFHFCAYSYILTTSGAKKILDYLTQSEHKSFTVSDHLLGHPSVGLVKYVACPLLSYCFQEEDPAYTQSQFNDLHRKDVYDSDIWNNTECFTEEELAPFRPGSAPASAPAPASASASASPVIPSSIDMYYLKTTDEPFQLYEQSWLEEMFQTKIQFKPLLSLNVMIPPQSWVIVQRPHSSAFHTYFQLLQDNNVPFHVLHLSDEFGTDCIDFYKLPNCKAVIRNYIREDIPTSHHILTIPLGYHHKPSPAVLPKSLDDRKLIWSFHGTNWFGRQDVLSSWMDVTPNNCVLTPEWNHSTMIKEHDYLQTLSNSKYIPILRGNNPETFRLYEALESGSIPISVRDQEHPFYQWLLSHLRVPLCRKEDALAIVQHIQQLPEREKYRSGLVQIWMNYKQHVKEQIRALLYS